MLKKSQIKTTVKLHFVTREIEVSFWLVEETDEEPWPKSTLLHSKDISLRWFGIFGPMKDIATVARQIARIQNDFLSKFKRTDGKYFNVIRNICAAYDGGEIVLNDGRTADFIAKFTTNNP